MGSRLSQLLPVVFEQIAEPHLRHELVAEAGEDFELLARLQLVHVHVLQLFEDRFFVERKVYARLVHAGVAASLLVPELVECFNFSV